MYQGNDVPEWVSVVGTPAFMDFVESIKREGVELEHRPMGIGTAPKDPLIVEVDNENLKKDIEALDIILPVLTPRIYREFKNLSEMDLASFSHSQLDYKLFSEAEKREIVFRDITTEAVTHTTLLDTITSADHQAVVGYFTQRIMSDLRLFSGLDILYPKVRGFIQNHLFKQPVDLNDLNTLRNLSEVAATLTIIETFKKRINELTIQDKGEAEIRNYLKISQTRPITVKDQEYERAAQSP